MEKGTVGHEKRFFYLLSKNFWHVGGQRIGVSTAQWSTAGFGSQAGNMFCPGEVMADGETQKF